MRNLEALCKYLWSESYLVVGGMYIHGRCNFISKTSWYMLGTDVRSAVAKTTEQLYVCSLFKLSQALGSAHGGW